MPSLPRSRGPVAGGWPVCEEVLAAFGATVAAQGPVAGSWLRGGRSPLVLWPLPKA